ncbi:hypothetical protein A3709_05895 [Halioglobus sp. HI00S01]|nr:hypothetical protein A3709_05895 [Halioglobus sp. HI00S01]
MLISGLVTVVTAGLFGISRRDRVNTAFVPGVAFTESAKRQVAALQNPVFSDCLLGIAGTGRVKTTVMAKKRAQQQLVTGDELYKEAAH